MKRNRNREKRCNFPKTIMIAGLLMLLAVGLAATAVTAFAGVLVVSWDPNDEPDLKGYKIYYGTTPDDRAGWTNIDVGNTTSHVVAQLTEGSMYHFVVTAYDMSENESEASEQVSAVVGPPVATAQKLPAGLTLRWTPIEGADRYEIFRSEKPHFLPDSPVATVQEFTYVDPLFKPMKRYAAYYVVKALAGGAVIHTFSEFGAYNIPLMQGPNLVSLPLIPVDNNINQVIGPQLTGGDAAFKSSLVLAWNGADYEAAWRVEGTTDALEGKWIDASGARVSKLSLYPDQSFWILAKQPADSVVTVGGLVSKDVERSITLKKGLNFVGASFPFEISLEESELYQDHVVIGSDFSAKADKLLRWIGKEFDYAWLVEGTGTELDGTWMNAAGSGPSDIKFMPGEGYVLWIIHDNPNKVWTLPNPYKP